MAASPMTLIQPNRTTSDPERDALVLRRIPPRRERRSDGEGGPGHAQHNADRENAGKAVDPNEPGQQQSRHDGHLADQAGELWLDVVDHEALLARVKSEIRGDLNSEWTQNDPNHEGHVEVEEGGEECRRVSRFYKLFAD